MTAREIGPAQDKSFTSTCAFTQNNWAFNSPGGDCDCKKKHN